MPTSKIYAFFDTKKMTYRNLLLTLLASVALALPWYFEQSTVIVFFSLLPFLFVAQQLSSRWALWRYTFLFIFLWLLLISSWLPFSGFDPVHYISLNLFMALIHATILWLGIIIARSNNVTSYIKDILFIGAWLAFEYIQKSWVFSDSITILGASLASIPEMIQWYEFTGVLGGSAWILLINCLAFRLLQNYQKRKLVTLAGIIISPVIVSLSLFAFYSHLSLPDLSVAAINPKVYSNTSDLDKVATKITQKNLEITKELLNNCPDIILWQEGSIGGNHFENALNENDESLREIKHLASICNNTEILAGLKIYNKLTGQAKDRRLKRNAYNCVLFIDNDENTENYPFKIKQKLVPFGEYFPYKNLLMNSIPAVIQWIPELEKRMFYNYSSDPDKGSIIFNKGQHKLGTLICYEALFAECTEQLVKNGAETIFVLSDESLYPNRVGAFQLGSQITLRAIEARRFIVKSCNYGSVRFTHLNGKMTASQDFDQEGGIYNKVGLYDKITFYMTHRNAVDLSYLFLGLLGLILCFTSRFKQF